MMFDLGFTTYWKGAIAISFTFILSIHSAEFQGNNIVARSHKPMLVLKTTNLEMCKIKMQNQINMKMICSEPSLKQSLPSKRVGYHGGREVR